jgi:NAD(P)-dependent dehydrogenase (short-subunit alcohol dehydrogenase family)
MSTSAVAASLTPRNAIVTGSAQGLGKSIALRLAADGCNVILNDLEKNQNLLDEVVNEIESKGGRAKALAGDVSNPKDVQGLIDLCVESYGSLDVVSSVSNDPIAKMLNGYQCCCIDDMQCRSVHR